MKERFFYLRRSGKAGMHRHGVVFLIVGDYVCARGVSLCNELDPFSRTCGINKAKGRAVKALERKSNSFPILREEALEKIPGTMINFKSEYNPMLSDFEIDILREKRGLASAIDNNR